MTSSIESTPRTIEKFKALCKTVENMADADPVVIPVFNKINFTSKDAIIVGCPKTGTNWMEQICHQIKMKGLDEDYEELTDLVPLLMPLSVYLGTDFNAPQKGDFKLFKTHGVPIQLPTSECFKNSKFIFLFRDPIDTLASFYDWEPSFQGYVRDGEHLTIEDFYKYRFAGKTADLNMLINVAAWLRHKNSVNHLILFYEDVRDNFSFALKQIADFLEVEMTATDVENVTHKSSSEYMKANQSKFDLHGLRKKIAEMQEGSLEQPLTKEIITATKTPELIREASERRGKDTIPTNIIADLRAQWRKIVGDEAGFTTYEDMRASLGFQRGPGN